MRLPYILMTVFRVLGPQVIRYEMLSTLEHLLLFQKRKLNVRTVYNFVECYKNDIFNEKE